MLDIDYETLIDNHTGLKLMIGKVFESVKGSQHGASLTFKTKEGEVFVFSHLQDCCETVWIDDIVGDLSDLVGSPILRAEQVSGEIPANKESINESVTYTFYKFATQKGYVDVRWEGSSNGYYSESVDMFYYIEN